MPNEDEHLIEKIASHEADFVRIYKEVYSVLKETEPAELPDSVVSELPRFEPPETIEPPKAAAILKAMWGSTPNDKFQLEDCYSVPMASGQSVSDFVTDSLRNFGIEYHDFWPYLRDRGWFEEA